jgi:hypothetical protein
VCDFARIRFFIIFKTYICSIKDIVWNELFIVCEMCTHDIDLQLVGDKMVREISLEVREKSGKSGNFFSIFWWEP